jgi:hypothetical protein
MKQSDLGKSLDLTLQLDHVSAGKNGSPREDDGRAVEEKVQVDLALPVTARHPVYSGQETARWFLCI